MLEEGRPDLVIAFPGGRGTANRMKRARAVGMKVEQVNATHSRRLRVTKA
jgi:hypothetical protein